MTDTVVGSRPAVNTRTILIVQTKFLGDLILSSVLVRNLRLYYPDARIVFLCAQGFRNFIVDHGIADDAIVLDKGAMRGRPLTRAREFVSLIRKLRGQRFDLVIDLTDSKTSRMINLLVHAPHRVGYDPPERPLKRFERQPANILAKPYGVSGEHFLDRYLSPLQALGLEPRELRPSICALPRATQTIVEHLRKHAVRANAFVVVHAGAAMVGRRWQPDRFATVIDTIRQRGLDVVLVGGPDETGTATAVLRHAASGIVNLVGILSLDETFAAISQAQMFLGNESGPMHMASAAGIPVVGLFGLTDPVKWGPVGVPQISVRPSHPCPCIAPGICKSIDPSRAYCVWRVTVESVNAAVSEMLEKMSPSAESH